jgi:hypothetical protein
MGINRLNRRCSNVKCKNEESVENTFLLLQPDGVALAVDACEGYAVGIATAQTALAAHLV